jgi:hypothetical protein
MAEVLIDFLSITFFVGLAGSVVLVLISGK